MFVVHYYFHIMYQKKISAHKSLLRCLWVVTIEMNKVSQKFQDYKAKQIVLKKKAKIHC